MKLRLAPMSAAILAALFPTLHSTARAADHPAIDLSTPQGEHLILNPGDTVTHPDAGTAVHVSGDANRLTGSGVTVTVGAPDNVSGSRAVNVEAGGRVELLDGSSVTVHGQNASAVHVGLDSAFLMRDGSLSTTGDNSAGLLITGNQNQMSKPAATLERVDIDTAGHRSAGVENHGDPFVMNRGNITTRGDGSHGLSGIRGRNDLDNVTIETFGDGSFGVFMQDREALTQMNNSSVLTHGDHAHGVHLTHGGFIDLLNANIKTEGDGAHGVSATDGGFLMVTDPRGSKIHTRGSAAHGMYMADATSGMRLSLTAIITEGADADGIRLESTGDKANVWDATIHSKQGNGIAAFDNKYLYVTNSRIRADGDERAGVLQQTRDGQLQLFKSSIETFGVQGIGLWNVNGVVVGNGNTITTRGKSGHGVVLQAVDPDATTEVGLVANTIETFGENAFGIIANGGKAVVEYGSITTHGHGAGGVHVSDDADFSLRHTVVETFGDDAFGFTATGGQVVLEGGKITTHGDGAAGIHASGLAGPLSVTGTRIKTEGGCTATACADALQFSGEARLDDAKLDATGLGTRGIWSYRTDGGDNRLSIKGGWVQSFEGTALQVTGSGLIADLENTSLGGYSRGGEKSLLLHVEALDGNIEAGHVQINARGTFLTGDVWLDSGSASFDLRDGSNLYGTLWDNAGRHVDRLALDDSSYWIMAGPSTVGQLHNTGTVIFANSDFITLDVTGDLTGGGMFMMRTDLAAGQGDLLRVGGRVSGGHQVLIENAGDEPDSEGGFLEIIRTEGGDGTFQLANYGGAVDLGTYRYILRTSDYVGGRETDWILVDANRPETPKPPEPPIDPPVTPDPPIDPPVTPDPPIDPPVTPDPPVEPPVTPDPPVEPPVTPDPPVEPPVTPEPPVVPPVIPPQPPVIRPPNPNNLSTTANAAIDTSAASTLQAIWHAETGALVKRLGERRAQAERDGAWVRGWAEDQQLDNQGGRPFDQTVRGVQAGTDRAFAVDGGRWYLGGLAGYSQTERRFGGEGTGRTRSVHLGGYATFLADDGWYFDALVKNNRFDSRFNVVATDGRSVRGHTRQNGTGLAVETGRQWTFGDGWFVEPQAAMTMLHVNGDAYRTSNGMRVKADGGNSLQLRASALLGKHVPLADGGFVQPYLKLGEVRELDGRSVVRTNGIATHTDLSGSRTEYGLGVTGSVNGRHHLYADVERAEGDRFDKPWSVNVGYRLSW